jgi:hypothetical protein
VPLIILIVAIGICVVLFIVRLRPGMVGGHKPRMWTLRDGTFMTGCSCGWAGRPRVVEADAQHDMDEHRGHPSQRPERHS